MHLVLFCLLLFITGWGFFFGAIVLAAINAPNDPNNGSNDIIKATREPITKEEMYVIFGFLMTTIAWIVSVYAVLTGAL